MKILNLLLIVLLLLTTSCNSNKKQEKLIEDTKALEIYRKIENKNDIHDYFKIELEAIVEKSDNFQLFYSEDYQLTFSHKDMITVPVSGKETYQKIVFNLPKNVFPERYRFDVGSNTNQEKIKINSLKVSYNTNMIHIPKDSISKYLTPNLYLSTQDNNGFYFLNTIDQEGVLPYDPYFTCSPELIRLLLKL